MRDETGWTPEESAAYLATLGAAAHVVVPLTIIQVCRDPKDNRVLEAALAGNVDYIVSGDKDLVDLGVFEGIPVVRAAGFTEIFGASG